MDKKIEDMSLNELKLYAKQCEIEFESNIKKDDLKNLINEHIAKKQENSDLPLEELILKCNDLKDKISEKNQRISNLQNENQNLSEKIDKLQKDISLSADEIINKVEYYEKVKDENNRQISVNLEKINEINTELKQLNIAMIKSTVKQSDTLKKQYDNITQKINEFPAEILNQMVELIKTYDSYQAELSEISSKIHDFTQITGINIDMSNKPYQKLTISERSQIIHRLKDLSKIHSRMLLR